MKDLPSDHLPIIISIKASIDPNANKHITFKSFNKAHWDEFTTYTEQHFVQHNNREITNIDHTTKLFNIIITNVDKKFVPKGNIRKMNPNYTPEIALLIRQRNNLKHNTQTPHSQETKERIQALNQEINKQIQDKKTENWRSFLETLNHSTNITHLYKTIKSITNSNSGITPSHAAITTTGTIPSHTKQADILIDHYANISHLKPTKDESNFATQIQI